MTAIAIFVKTPGLSPLKTRLAESTGRAWAERWYIQAARAVAEAAHDAAIGPIYWAVAESKARQHRLWQDHPVIWQGSGDLGARMASVHGALIERHASALLLGADTPQLNPQWLQQAANWLECDPARCCMGPARDGGFWTFGANRAVSVDRWQQVPYSDPTTLQRFRQVMAECGASIDLPILTDLDTESDIPALMAELKALTKPLPHQARLLDWMLESSPIDEG